MKQNYTFYSERARLLIIVTFEDWENTNFGFWNMIVSK